jgi:hypothetical protein
MHFLHQSQDTTNVVRGFIMNDYQVDKFTRAINTFGNGVAIAILVGLAINGCAILLSGEKIANEISHLSLSVVRAK